MHLWEEYFVTKKSQSLASFFKKKKNTIIQPQKKYSWNWITIIPALRISTSCPNFFYVYIQGKKLVKFNFMKCFDNILYDNLTNHTNNAMFFCQKKILKNFDFWFFFTFFFFDFFLSFPFSGVESNEATDPGCEVEGESSFFGFSKYNMI